MNGPCLRRVAAGCALIAATSSLAPPSIARADDAPAQRSPDEAYIGHMTNGVKLFNSNDFAAAIAEFEAAYRAVPKASPLINQALCYRELKKYPRAVERLELALAKHEEGMSADDKSAATKAIADMRALFAYATLAVQPESATVMLDGEVLDPAALAAPIALSPGDHEITASAVGYLPQAKKINVVSNDRVSIAMSLAPARGTLRVITARPDTMIELDGKPQVPGAWQGELPAGSVMVRAVGETGAGAVEIVAGRTTTIDLSKGSTALPPLPADAAKPEGPKRGLYGQLNGSVLVPFRHPKVFSDESVSSGGYVGLRGGYRVHTYAAFEGMIEYGNVEGPANGAGDKTYSLSAIRIGPALRLMSPGDLVHFVGTVGGGVAVHLMSYEDLAPDDAPPLCVGGRITCDSNGLDFYVMTEAGVEIDFDGVLIGGGLALYLSGTKGMEDNPLDAENVKTTEVAKPYENGLLLQLGPRVYVGYAFW